MPRHESAKKRMRQNEKRRKHNKSQKSRVRTKIKKLRSLNDKEEAQELLNDIKGDLDRLAAKGIIHRTKPLTERASSKNTSTAFSSFDEDVPPPVGERTVLVFFFPPARPSHLKKSAFCPRSVRPPVS